MTTTTTNASLDTSPSGIADRIRAAYDAMGRGDMEPMRQLMADDVTYLDVSDGPAGGVHRGWDSIVGLWAQLAELSGGTAQMDLDDVAVPDENRAVVFATTRWTVDGQTAAERAVLVYYLEGGRVRTAYLMHEDPAAPEAFAGR